MATYPIELLIPSVSDPTLAPPGLHTMTTGAQQLPFYLAAGNWNTGRDEFVESVVRSIEAFSAPGFESSIRASVAITPLDLQRTYGLPEGNIFHGAMSLNQLFVLGARRPGPPGTGHQRMGSSCAERGCTRGWGRHGRCRAQRRHDIDRGWRRRRRFLRRAERPSWLRCRLTGSAPAVVLDGKLNIPDSQNGNRRVLAVVAYISEMHKA